MSIFFFEQNIRKSSITGLGLGMK